MPDICGFLDGKKHTVDNDPEATPFDDVRHYAYEGDGNTTGSLSSLASGIFIFIYIYFFERYFLFYIYIARHFYATRN